MNLNYDPDKHLLDQIDKVLESGQPSGDTVVDELATTRPTMRSTFQTALEERLLARLEQIKQGETPMVNSTSYMTIPTPRRNWLPLTLLAALIVVAIAGVMLINGRGKAPRINEMALALATGTATKAATGSIVPPVVSQNLRLPGVGGVAPVVIAARDIPQGTILSSHWLETVYWADDTGSTQTYTDVEVLRGAVAKQDIPRWQPIISAYLTDQPVSTIHPTDVPSPNVNVVVAFQNLPRGYTFSDSVLDNAAGYSAWPADSIPAGAIRSNQTSNITMLYGKTLQNDIQRGQPILATMLEGNLSLVSSSIMTDSVAVDIPLNLLTSDSYLPGPGGAIDVVAQLPFKTDSTNANGLVATFLPDGKHIVENLVMVGATIVFQQSLSTSVPTPTITLAIPNEKAGLLRWLVAQNITFRLQQPLPNTFDLPVDARIITIPFANIMTDENIQPNDKVDIYSTCTLIPDVTGINNTVVTSKTDCTQPDEVLRVTKATVFSGEIVVNGRQPVTTYQSIAFAVAPGDMPMFTQMNAAGMHFKLVKSSSADQTQPTATLPSGITLHTVTGDENIVSIAFEYGTTIRILSELNPEIVFSQCDFGVGSGGSECTVLLYPGQQIRVPAPTPAIPSPADQASSTPTPTAALAPTSTPSTTLAASDENTVTMSIPRGKFIEVGQDVREGKAADIVFSFFYLSRPDNSPTTTPLKPSSQIMPIATNVDVVKIDGQNSTDVITLLVTRQQSVIIQWALDSKLFLSLTKIVFDIPLSLIDSTHDPIQAGDMIDVYSTCLLVVNAASTKVDCTQPVETKQFAGTVMVLNNSLDQNGTPASATISIAVPADLQMRLSSMIAAGMHFKIAKSASVDQSQPAATLTPTPAPQPTLARGKITVDIPLADITFITLSNLQAAEGVGYNKGTFVSIIATVLTIETNDKATPEATQAVMTLIPGEVPSQLTKVVVQTALITDKTNNVLTVAVSADEAAIIQSLLDAKLPIKMRPVLPVLVTTPSSNTMTLTLDSIYRWSTDKLEVGDQVDVVIGMVEGEGTPLNLSFQPYGEYNWIDPFTNGAFNAQTYIPDPATKQKGSFFLRGLLRNATISAIEQKIDPKSKRIQSIKLTLDLSTNTMAAIALAGYIDAGLPYLVIKHD
ncbi:MAG: hypothetical protein H0X30_06140 [Anaerolineae bacterium]|nr:hypothetical protein [Anaerolineae bacterium]